MAANPQQDEDQTKQSEDTQPQDNPGKGNTTVDSNVEKSPVLGENEATPTENVAAAQETAAKNVEAEKAAQPASGENAK